ncbi:MAG: hypothetical protein ACTJHU_02735 [Mycetocola sp.]
MTPPAPALSPAVRRTRLVLAATVLTLPLVAILITAALWWDTLPSEIASHWSGAGPADGAVPPAGHLTMCLVLAGIGAVGAWVVAWVPGLSPRARRGSFAFCGVPAGLGVSIWLVSITVTIAAGDAYAAVLGPWLLVVLASTLYGLIAVPIAPGGQAAPLVPADRVDRITLSDSEDSAWSAVISGRLFVYLAIALVVLYVGIMIPIVVSGESGGAVVTVSLGLATVALVLVFARIRVSIDRRGLRASGLAGIPLKRVPLSSIASVEVRTIEPGEWGGWGYRIMPGGSAIVMRRGPGFVITMTNGKFFAVTVSDPNTPAALLATLIERDNPNGDAASPTRVDG